MHTELNRRASGQPASEIELAIGNSVLSGKREKKTI